MDILAFVTVELAPTELGASSDAANPATLHQPPPY